MSKKLCFHKGRCDKIRPGPKLGAMFDSFSSQSDWCSGLMYSLKTKFDEIEFLVSVPKPEHSIPPRMIDGIKFEVVSFDELNKRKNECDVFFHRAFPKDLVPPEGPKSVYYSSDSAIYPKQYSDNWDVILTTTFDPTKINQKIGKNVYPWIKGENTNFWFPDDSKKTYDFVVVGRPRKEIQIVKDIANFFPESKIAAIGWEPFEFEKVKNIKEFGRLNHKKVREILRQSKMAIIVTIHGDEGFPMQTQMEFSIMGLYYLYDKTMKVDGYYTNNKTGARFSRNFPMEDWKVLGKISKEFAINHFSSDKSAECLINILERINR